MKKTAKNWFLIPGTILAFGLIIFVAIMTRYNWDFTKLNATKYETNTYEIIKSFSNIAINTDTADIVFAQSIDSKCRVDCYEEAKAPHSATVLEDTLSIEAVNNKSWYDYIGINFSSPKITVYLPKSEYASLSISESTGDIVIPKGFNFNAADISLSTGDVAVEATSKLLKIKTSTGDISVKNTLAEKLDLSASTGSISVSDTNCTGNANLNISTGKTTLTNFKCKNLNSSGDTGDLFLNGVVATEKLSVIRDTGDIKIDASDANEIFIETDTGDVKGSLLTDKVVTTETDTGRVDVPKTITGGKCEITTETGDIKISVQNSLQQTKAKTLGYF